MSHRYVSTTASRDLLLPLLLLRHCCSSCHASDPSTGLTPDVSNALEQPHLDVHNWTDVLKVRMQLEGEGGGVRHYKGFVDAARVTVRTEGVSALYKGLSPALVRQATYGSARIGMYEPIKTVFTPSDLPEGADLPLLSKLAAGITAGALASGVFNRKCARNRVRWTRWLRVCHVTTCSRTCVSLISPWHCVRTTPHHTGPAAMDVIKVRMMAERTAKDASGKATAPRYRSVVHAFTTIARTEGLRGLYAGVAPTTQRAALVAGVELSTYDEIKQTLVRLLGMDSKSIVTHFAASFGAGFLSTVASSPFDVVKSRVMNQPTGPDGRGLVYKSTGDCFKKTIRSEGVMALYKGFWPNFGRIGPHAVTMFMVIEQLRNWFE